MKMPPSSMFRLCTVAATEVSEGSFCGEGACLLHTIVQLFESALDAVPALHALQVLE